MLMWWHKWIFIHRVANTTAFRNGQAARGGKQIVQRVLDRETEASKGNQAQTALTRDNYDFTLMGDTVLDGRPCYLLGLKPKRKRKNWFQGRLGWIRVRC